VAPAVLDEVRQAVPDFGVRNLDMLLHGGECSYTYTMNSALTDAVDEHGMVTEQALTECLSRRPVNGRGLPPVTDCLPEQGATDRGFRGLT
jgi:hypothetical protein